MQFHRLASLILGIWLGASVFMDLVATQNFRSVGRVITSMDLKGVENARKVGDPEAVRALLRRFAGEVNAFLFEQWESAELLILFALFLVLLFGRTYQKLAMGLCLLMMCLVAAQRFELTPRITALSRELEFDTGASRRFAAYHAAYGYVEIGKLVLGLMLAGSLLVRRRTDRKAFVREYERERGIA